MKKARFRFYEELNDFLPVEHRKITFPYHFNGRPSVKDAIEAIGVPHVEVDLVLVNGQSVDFTWHIRDGDRISVYPVFESLDITDITRLRPQPLRETRFILDVHFGGLARYLRMLGFDTAYDNSWDDNEIIETAVREHRIILTHDVELLKDGRVTHGYWVRSNGTHNQVREVFDRFDLRKLVKPFSRCLVCNALLRAADRDEVEDRLPFDTLLIYDEFHECQSCGRVYWKGSHYDNMKLFLESLISQHDDSV